MTQVIAGTLTAGGLGQNLHTAERPASAPEGGDPTLQSDLFYAHSKTSEFEWAKNAGTSRERLENQHLAVNCAD